MGADKWAQVVDPAWYGGDPDARDAAVARLPRVAVAPRHGHEVVDHPLPGGPPADALLLPVPGDVAHVSATAVRSGRVEWAALPHRLRALARRHALGQPPRRGLTGDDREDRALRRPEPDQSGWCVWTICDRSRTPPRAAEVVSAA
jgi:hypothetical protein